MTGIRRVLGKIDETVRELWCGILIWGVVCQALPVWLVKDRLRYSLGLWCGVALAWGCAYHMWRVLDRALENEAGAQETVRKQSLIRYGVILAAFAVMMLTSAVNPLSAFLGLMGLKAGAYMQPFVHRRLGRRKEKEVKL